MTASFRNVSPDPSWNVTADLEAASVKGIFSLWGPRDPKRTDLTGSLSAWAWTMSRAVDYIEPDPALTALYEERYQKFKAIYPTVKPLFKVLKEE